MRILLAWEIGRNYGHVMALAELAQAMAKKHRKKAEIFFVLQSPGAVLPFVEGLEYRLLQAPFSAPKPQLRLPQAAKDEPARLPKDLILTYTDELRQWGYDNPQVLAGLVRAWRDLYAAIKPDVIVANAAPTALLAAKGLKIKIINFGSSYDVPAKAVPMPMAKTTDRVSPQLLLDREGQVVDIINKAQALNGLKPIKTIADMLKANAEFITMFEDLDYYAERSKLEKNPPHYFGQFFSLENGAEISWNKKSEKRILAYLLPETPTYVEAMNGLSRLPKTWDIIISSPGLPEDVRKATEGSNLRIVTGPVKLAGLLKDCDLGISHATQGMSCALAINGVPQLLIPIINEQLVFAKGLGRNKLAQGIVGRFSPEKIVELVHALLSNPEYNENAKAFAKKHKGFKPDKLAETIADKIIEFAQEGK